MPLYLNTDGRTTAAIGLCDRCKMKRYSDFLVPDPNSPGLRVCMDTCVDVLDPWRLPPRSTEDITVKGVRPEVPLTNPTTYTFTYTALSGTFAPGETILGSITRTQQQLVSASAGAITFKEVNDAQVFVAGEKITGLTSGATGTVTSEYGGS